MEPLLPAKVIDEIRQNDLVHQALDLLRWARLRYLLLQSSRHVIGWRALAGVSVIVQNECQGNL